MRLSLLKSTITIIGFCACMSAIAQPLIRLGVTSGPHAQIAEVVAKVAKTKGLDVQLVEFSDGVLINEATSNGDIDANAFQHTPYLNQHIKDRGVRVVSAARTVLLPSAIYSHKYNDLSDVPNGALISIPNDPSNAGRTLKILDQAGFITLKEGLGFEATELDILKNPKGVKILSLDPAQLPRSLADVDLSVINSYIALNANLLPSRDGLLVEDELSDYFCLIGVHEDRQHEPWVHTLVESYRSPEVKQFLTDTFDGNVIAGW